MKLFAAILEAITGLAAFGLAWYWYDWRLALIVFLAVFSSNLNSERLK